MLVAARMVIAESGRRPSGAVKLKRGPTGRMQISAELVPIPDAYASRMRPGCVLDASRMRSGYVPDASRNDPFKVCALSVYRSL